MDGAALDVVTERMEFEPDSPEETEPSKPVGVTPLAEPFGLEEPTGSGFEPDAELEPEEFAVPVPPEVSSPDFLPAVELLLFSSPDPELEPVSEPPLEPFPFPDKLPSDSLSALVSALGPGLLLLPEVLSWTNPDTWVVTADKVASGLPSDKGQ